MQRNVAQVQVGGVAFLVKTGVGQQRGCGASLPPACHTVTLPPWGWDPLSQYYRACVQITLILLITAPKQERREAAVWPGHGSHRA